MSTQTDEVPKKGRPAKKAMPPKYEKIKLEISGYKDNKPVLKEVSVMRTCHLTELDAKILNSQERNTLIRYKKK